MVGSGIFHLGCNSRQAGLGGPRGLCRALRGWREILGRIQWGPEQESLPESQEIGLCVHSAVKISTYK